MRTTYPPAAGNSREQAGRDKLARRAAATAGLAAVSCLGLAAFIILGIVANAGGTALFFVSLGAAIAAVVLAIRVLLIARREHRVQEARTAWIALALAVGPWLILYTLIAIFQGS